MLVFLCLYCWLKVIRKVFLCCMKLLLQVCICLICFRLFCIVLVLFRLYWCSLFGVSRCRLWLGMVIIRLVILIVMLLCCRQFFILLQILCSLWLSLVCEVVLELMCIMWWMLILFDSRWLLLVVSMNMQVLWQIEFLWIQMVQFDLLMLLLVMIVDFICLLLEFRLRMCLWIFCWLVIIVRCYIILVKFGLILLVQCMCIRLCLVYGVRVWVICLCCRFFSLILLLVLFVYFVLQLIQVCLFFSCVCGYG